MLEPGVPRSSEIPPSGDAPFARRRAHASAGEHEASGATGAESASAAERARRIERLRWLGAFLDSAIEVPGLKFRFGLDPLIGLLPGIGDAATTAIALYIIYEARKLGASNRQIAAMFGNVAIDLLVGSVPVLGDLFDAGFKANVRNLRMLGIEVGGGLRDRPPAG